jgi:hypothetical protein
VEGDELEDLREALAHIHDEEFEQSWLQRVIRRICSPFRRRDRNRVIKIQAEPPKRTDKDKNKDAA